MGSFLFCKISVNLFGGYILFTYLCLEDLSTLVIYCKVLTSEKKCNPWEICLAIIFNPRVFCF